MERATGSGYRLRLRLTRAVRYLVDTTVLIDASRQQEPALTWMQTALRDRVVVAVSTISIAEFVTGFRPDERPRWEAFTDELTHWNVTTGIAVRAGGLRYELRRQGRTLLLPDALIAATAIAHGAVLVTANVKDFSVAGVALIPLTR